MHVAALPLTVRKQVETDLLHRRHIIATAVEADTLDVATRRRSSGMIAVRGGQR